MEFLNLENASVEQKFILMLSEKIEKLEDEICSIKKSLYAKPKNTSSVSQDLYNKLKEIHKIHEDCNLNKIKIKLENTVPPYILQKVPIHLYQYLDNALSYDINKYSYAVSYALMFLESYHEIDNDFLTWYKNKLNID